MKYSMRAAFRAAGLLAAVMGLSAALTAQTSRIDGGSLSFEGFGFYWETHLVPAVPALSDAFGTAAVSDASGTIHRCRCSSTPSSP